MANSRTNIFLSFAIFSLLFSLLHASRSLEPVDSEQSLNKSMMLSIGRGGGGSSIGRGGGGSSSSSGGGGSSIGRGGGANRKGNSCLAMVVPVGGRQSGHHNGHSAANRKGNSCLAMVLLAAVITLIFSIW
ncbi:uncharacterized protein A4U43_C04F6990 [Asparagus officinalis]|uniref:Glycine-rich protein n=1 Tax=Asparagus officinalis TaxID=4686 RepID=A0A5P1EZI4_ASPOF|nr:uncharacterized protein A4U43_C04F6990 [Asparagus officinalis]